MELTPAFIHEKFTSIITNMEEHHALYTFKPEDFSRMRKITFSDSIYHTISRHKDSSKVELLQYFNYSKDTPTLSAMIQQQKKIPASTFAAIFHQFNQNVSVDNTIKGYTPIAVDGTSIKIPRNPKDPDTYRITDKYEKGYNALHLITGFHILNQTFTDAVIQPGNYINEYSAMCEIIERFSSENPEKKPLFIADRGFSSFNVMAHAIENNSFFLIRAKDSKDSFVKKFLGSLDSLSIPDDGILYERWLTRRRTKTVKSQPEVYKSIKQTPFDYLELKSRNIYYISFRIVPVKLKNGKSEILLTNLPIEDFSSDELKELYHMRWSIETSFRDIKYTAGLLSFHSRNKELILQEIYSKLILYNYTRFITIASEVKKETDRYRYQINFVMAISICVDFLLHYTVKKAEEIADILSQGMVPVRENRSSPRFLKARTAVSFQYR